MTRSEDRYMGSERFEVPFGDDRYPRQLAIAPRPPSVLRGYGNADVLGGGLAVVGARKATPYGIMWARTLAARAASCGVVVISGGAIGCDQAALEAAVMQASPAVFVMAGGPDMMYPRGASDLAARIIANGGAVVSEQPWGTPVSRGRFIARNRIIAGLADATLVVEAGDPSGTFLTADFANDAGREVLSVPGSLNSPQSRGSNRLISEGAQAVVGIESFDMHLERIFGVLPQLMGMGETTTAPVRAVDGDPATTRLIDMLRASPMRTEELMEHASLGARELAVLLTRLETLGAVSRCPDGRYVCVT